MRPATYALFRVVFFATVAIVTPLVAQQYAPPPPAQLSWRVPTLTATKGTQLTQAKGGISLTVEPFEYTPKIEEAVSFDPQSLGAYRADQQVFCKMFTSSVSVVPDQISFTIAIENGLERVFRGTGFLGAGAVISLRIDGKRIAFDQSGITELLDVVVLPEEKGQVTIYGPNISTLGESGTIDFLVYDVVTAVDAAGTPTERQNYAWHYDYTVASNSKTVPIRGELLIGPTLQQARPVRPGDADWAVCPRWIKVR
jgi:hypothetical protein